MLNVEHCWWKYWSKHEWNILIKIGTVIYAKHYQFFKRRRNIFDQGQNNGKILMFWVWIK